MATDYKTWAQQYTGARDEYSQPAPSEGQLQVWARQYANQNIQDPTEYWKFIADADPAINNLQQAVFGHGANAGSLLPHEEMTHDALKEIAQQAGLPENFDWWPHLAAAAYQNQFANRTNGATNTTFDIGRENTALLVEGAIKSAMPQYPQLEQALPLVQQGSPLWQQAEDLRNNYWTYGKERKSSNFKQWAAMTALAFGGGALLGGLSGGAAGAGSAAGAEGALGSGLTATAAEGGLSAGLAAEGATLGGGALGSGLTATAAEGGLSAGLASGAGAAGAAGLGTSALGSGLTTTGATSGALAPSAFAAETLTAPAMAGEVATTAAPAATGALETAAAPAATAPAAATTTPAATTGGITSGQVAAGASTAGASGALGGGDGGMVPGQGEFGELGMEGWEGGIPGGPGLNPGMFESWLSGLGLGDAGTALDKLMSLGLPIATIAGLFEKPDNPLLGPIVQAAQKAIGKADEYSALGPIGLTPAQEQAIALAKSNVGNYQPYLDRSGALADTAAAGITTDQIDRYTNPYLDDVLNPAIRDIEEASARRREQLRAITSMSGNDLRTPSTDPNRFNVEDSLLDRETFRTIGDVSGKLRAESFNTATGLAGQDLDRSLSSSNIYGGLGKTAGALGAADVASLTGAGALERLPMEDERAQIANSSKLYTDVVHGNQGTLAAAAQPSTLTNVTGALGVLKSAKDLDLY